MREDDSDWFLKWDDELPSPEELTPLSQTLITPDLALAFNIAPQPNFSGELDSPELSVVGGGSAAAGSEEPARTFKRPRLVWTPQLHKRFVDAVVHLGIKNAVPKTIMRIMSVEGLTRENVASHLQKYRLYLKRMQGISGGGDNGRIPSISGFDPATDHLFSSSPTPPHFLHLSRKGSEHHSLPFETSATTMPHHQHQAAAALAAHHLPQHFRNSSSYSPPQKPMQRMPLYADDFESANGKKVLTLFPAGHD